MTASAAEVEAAQKAYGCEQWVSPYVAAARCRLHPDADGFLALWTDRGCPVAVAQNERLRREVEEWRLAREFWHRVSTVADDKVRALESEVARLSGRLAHIKLTHGPTSTEHGPDYCKTCSESAQEWVKWPCAVADALTEQVQP